MKIAKYRGGRRQKGKYWEVPDTWMGPFHALDEVWFSKNEAGEWELVADLIRNDGDGPVCIMENGETKAYKLPKWLQKTLDALHLQGAKEALWAVRRITDEIEKGKMNR